MKSKIKTLALILIGATTAFTVSSCLGIALTIMKSETLL